MVGVDGVVGVDFGFLNEEVRDKRLDGLLVFLGVGISLTVSKIRIVSSLGDIKFTSGADVTVVLYYKKERGFFFLDQKSLH